MTEIGDRVVMVPLRDGGKAAISSGSIEVGDRVVMIPIAGGSFATIRLASPEVGDKVIVYPISGGGYACLKKTVGNGIWIVDEWHAPGEYQTEWYGPFSVYYDGIHPIYVSSRDDDIGEIKVDDRLLVNTDSGSYEKYTLYPTIYDCTSAFAVGENPNTYVGIRDSGAVGWGTYTTLYLYSVAW